MARGESHRACPERKDRPIKRVVVYLSLVCFACLSFSSQAQKVPILAGLFPSPQSYLRFVNGWAGRSSAAGLSPSVKRLLSPFFQKAGLLFPRALNLDYVRVHKGVPAVVRRFAVIDVGAMVINYDEYRF